MKIGNIKHSLLAGVAALSVFALSANVASANLWYLQANLDGLQEVGPNASPGTGVANITLDDISGAVNVIGGSFFAGLVAPSTAAHIHGSAPPGVNAGVIVPLVIPGGATAGPISGGGVLSAPLVAAMLAGNTYVNVHSQAFPGGEIRGQVLVVPEPGMLSLTGLGVVGLFVRARSKTRMAKA